MEGAYKAVMKPTEGTILTVARVASEEAAACGAEEIPALWDVVMTAGQKALEDTPNLLPVLKKAGVVDAGGQGIMVIFEGMGKVFHGEAIIAGGEAAPNKAKLSTENAGKGVFTDDLMKVEDITNGYCTQFLINKNEGASAAKMRAFAESNGDSVVCIEDDDVINLHVHTADPGKILSEAIKYGYLTNFKIENMHEQFLARQKQGKSLEKQASAEKAPSQASEFIYAAVDPSRDYGFVAVAAGEGLKAVFGDLGVDAVVSGGQTMNPSTEAILKAVESIRSNPKHMEVSATQYAGVSGKSAGVDSLDVVLLGATQVDLDFNVNVHTDSNGYIMGGSGGHCDTAAGAKLAIIIAPLTRARLPLVVDRCLCISTPGKTVDVVVTQRGIAVNTEGGKNVELKEKLKEAKLPVVEIADLKRMAEEIAGVPKPVQMGDKVVANVIYRDGTLLDVIHSVK